MKLPITLLAALLAATFLTTSRAQIVSCNAFLKGNHVEVGINWMGAYGSAVDAPAGYHPNLVLAKNFYNDSACGGMLNTVANPIGFVADPNLTNWTAYYGDYYLPGTPQEGWALEVDGRLVYGYTPYMQMPNGQDSNLSGAITSYTSSSTFVSAKWEGTFDSIQITQETVLDTGALYFNVYVTLTNLASAPKNNVYYMRTVDPDNEQTLTGTYSTINKITHQMPGDPDSLVSVTATGDSFGARLALATKDPRAKCFIFDAGLTPSGYSLKQMYDQHTPYRYDTATYRDDIGIALVTNVGRLASVDSARDSVSGFKMTSKKRAANSNSLNFAYSFDNDLNNIKDMFSGYPLATPILSANKTPLLLYPNPVTDVCYLKGMEEDDQLEVYNINGANIVGTLSIEPTGRITRISGLAAGQYFAIVRNKQGAILLRQRLVRL